MTSSPLLKSSSIARPTATHPYYPKTPESPQRLSKALVSAATSMGKSRRR